VYLLRYKRDGEWRVVMIANAVSVAHPRMAPGSWLADSSTAAGSTGPLWRCCRATPWAGSAGLTAFVEARISRPPAPCGGRAGLARLRGDGPGARFAHAVGLDAALAQLQAPR